MRGHATTITGEVDRMVADWAETGGEIDLLDWFAELTIYTSSACLIGPRFRGHSTARLPVSTTTWSGAPTPSPTSIPTPTSRASGVVTLPVSAWSSWCRRSWTIERFDPVRATTTGTCSTC